MPRSFHLRPIWFCDSPVGLDDGSFARIGNSLIWYQGVEVRTASGVRQLSLRDLPLWLDQLGHDQRLRAELLLQRIGTHRAPLQLGERVIRFDTPQVMGILNMTPDSFSDGGKHMADPRAAADSGFAMMAQGAAIIDVGGESTRPGAETVWEGDEIERVVPVIEHLARSGAVVSIDTRKASVMEAALAAGAHIVNDVSALLYDPRSIEVVAQAGCPVVLMHAAGQGEDAHAGRNSYGAGAYEGASVDARIFDWLDNRIEQCVAAGIGRDKIIVDPGIGFGKALQDDATIINRLAMLHGLGVPLLFGASRKRIIGALSNEAPVSERLGGSIALAYQSAVLGANILRVHDVAESVQALRVWRGLRDAALVAG